MSREQKVSFIHILFKRDAEQFYFDELSQMRQWGELATTFSRRYNSEARTHAITDELREIQLTRYTDSDISDGQVLQKVARRIEKLVPRCPRGENSNRNKRETLYYAVRMTEWAQAPISDLAGNGSRKTYKEFLDELTAAEQQQKIKDKLQRKMTAVRKKAIDSTGISKLQHSTEAVI